MSKVRFAAILDAQNAVIYAKVDDGVRSEPYFVRGPAIIVSDAAPLIDNVRAKEAVKQPSHGIPGLVVSSRIELVGEQAVLLSASLFQPDFGTARPKGPRAPILITAMPIAGTLEEFFGTRFLLSAPRISALSDLASNRARAEIATGSRGEAWVLSWEPPRPASDLVYRSAPLIAAVSLVLLAGAVYVLRTSRIAARTLINREQVMRHAATHDPLTGLSNRMLLATDYELSLASGKLIVVCIDLDGFKAINDTHGHAAGDDLLKVVAARLRAGTREMDHLFRLGGDEFVILMPDLALEEAEQVCQRLAAAISEPIVYQGEVISVGACFGVKPVIDRSTPYATAIDAADAALYQAKRLGRGRVVAA